MKSNEAIISTLFCNRMKYLDQMEVIENSGNIDVSNPSTKYRMLKVEYDNCSLLYDDLIQKGA